MNGHGRFVKLGSDTDPAIAVRLINHYAASRSPKSISYARRLFDRVPLKDTVLWSSIISAFTKNAQPQAALHLFAHMLRQCQQPNHFVYASVATACASSAGARLHLGRTVHGRVIKLGFTPHYVLLETAFLDMYSKCSSVDCARKLFDEMSQRNLVTWNAMIAGYVLNNMDVDGLWLFYRMKCLEFLVPDEFTAAAVLGGCAKAEDVKLGSQVHGFLIAAGYESNCVNFLCNMYFHCAEVAPAERAANGAEDDPILKLIKIRGYAFNQMHHALLKCITVEKHPVSLLKANCAAFVPILAACTRLSLLRVGRQLHGLLTTFDNVDGLVEDGDIIGSALIDLYCKCNSLDEAQKVFHNWLPSLHIFHWNSLIGGCMHNGLVEKARALWKAMPQERNVASWTCMISGYVHNGMPREGLLLLSQMHASMDRLRVEGNSLTFVSGLQACSRLANLERGKQIHARIIRTLPLTEITNPIVGTALVDAYSKSGSLDYARAVFDRMLHKHAAAWSTLVMGYAIHGAGPVAVEAFQAMIEKGFEPNEVTFVSVLTACSHGGLVGEGLHCFELMKKRYQPAIRVDHLVCVVDMLGRAGQVEEAWAFVEGVEEGGGVDGEGWSKVFGAVLGACHLHGNVEVGKRVAQKMLARKEIVPSTYISLSNVYAAAGMWDEAYMVREDWRRETDVNEGPGCSQDYCVCWSRGFPWIRRLSGCPIPQVRVPLGSCLAGFSFLRFHPGHPHVWWDLACCN